MPKRVYSAPVSPERISVPRPGLDRVAGVVAVLAPLTVTLGNLYVVYLLWTHGHHGWALIDLLFGTGLVLAVVGPIFAFTFALIATTPLGRKKVRASPAPRHESGSTGGGQSSAGDTEESNGLLPPPNAPAWRPGGPLVDKVTKYGPPQEPIAFMSAQTGRAYGELTLQEAADWLRSNYGWEMRMPDQSSALGRAMLELDRERAAKRDHEAGPADLD
jgi:hypothetical protein